MKRRFADLFSRSLLTWIVLLIVPACNIFVSNPRIAIISPPSGSQVREGEEIVVQSVSSDSSGITRVELTVDTTLVRTDPFPSPQTSSTISQTWTATPGTHTIIVRAYNKTNLASDPAAISILVLPATSTPTPVAVATTVPVTPTVPLTITPIGCTNEARFVADVTVPDGTTFNSGQTFEKTWRLTNAGTCAWGTGYRFGFVSGTAMTPNTVVNVPATAPDASVDIKVPLTAPNAGGSYTGNWQLRSPTNSLFGPRVTVVINVPAPSLPSGCAIAYLTASPTAINATEFSTLSWGAVTGAQSVEIDQGIGGVGTPGSRAVSPAMTTTFTLTAHCGAYDKTAQVTITVNLSPGCIGTPNITSFYATNTSIGPGGWTTLTWGPVTNAALVEIDPDIGGVASPGSVGVSPATTTTYTLTASCHGKIATRQVTVEVNK